MNGVFRHELTVSDTEVLAALGDRTGMRFGYGSTDPRFSYRLSRAAPRTPEPRHRGVVT